MKKISLGHKIIFGVMALLLAFGVAMGPAQVFAAPAFDTQATTATPTPGTTTAKTCQERKDQIIAKLEEAKGRVQKHIDDLKAKIAKADKPELKQKLEKALDHAQKRLDHINERLTKVKNHVCKTADGNGTTSGQ
jgi:peptidoglycan hydrolase CwlO-like protein